MPSSPETDFVPVGRALVDWYSGRARDLPWRRSVSPYRVLVSEIMLQQTRTEAVVPRFEAFLQRFPDVAVLAAAPEEEVLKAWEGLGYYSRARNLHRAARILAESDREIPDTEEALRKLPGIGDYTAAAVLSIAFRQPVAAVDANAVRIVFRLLACTDDPAASGSRRLAKECLEAMMPKDAPDTFTQAMMELGQTVCRPRQAGCTSCPVSPWCAGKKDPLQYPKKAQARPKPETQLTVAVLCTAGKVALRKRPEKGLLAGLYEPLHWEGRLTEAELAERLREMGLTAAAMEPLASWRHEFTHRVWQLGGWRVAVTKTEELGDVIWVDRQELADRYAVPTAFRPALSEWENIPWINLWSRDPFSGIT